MFHPYVVNYVRSCIVHLHGIRDGRTHGHVGARAPTLPPFIFFKFSHKANKKGTSVFRSKLKKH